MAAGMLLTCAGELLAHWMIPSSIGQSQELGDLKMEDVTGSTLFLLSPDSAVHGFVIHVSSGVILFGLMYKYVWGDFGPK